MILYGAIFGCLSPVLSIAAFLSYTLPFIYPKEEKQNVEKAKQTLLNSSLDGTASNVDNKQSDHLLMVVAYNKWARILHGNGSKAAQQLCRSFFLNNSVMYTIRVGICCDCCKEVMSLLKFEAHAGSNLQQPWSNIFLLSGKTLLQCLKEAWDQKMMQNKVGVETVGIDDLDPSDDTCGVCADGGHLICCDGCPSTFHQECMMLKVLPKGC